MTSSPLRLNSNSFFKKLSKTSSEGSLFHIWSLIFSIFHFNKKKKALPRLQFFNLRNNQPDWLLRCHFTGKFRSFSPLCMTIPKQHREREAVTAHSWLLTAFSPHGFHRDRMKIHGFHCIRCEITIKLLIEVSLNQVCGPTVCNFTCFYLLFISCKTYSIIRTELCFK